VVTIIIALVSIFAIRKDKKDRTRIRRGREK